MPHSEAGLLWDGIVFACLSPPAAVLLQPLLPASGAGDARPADARQQVGTPADLGHQLIHRVMTSHSKLPAQCGFK